MGLCPGARRLFRLVRKVADVRELLARKEHNILRHNTLGVSGKHYGGSFG